MTDDFDSLDPNVRWIATEAKRPVAMGAAARERLLEALRAEPAPERAAPIMSWLSEPRRFALPPLAAAALAAGLVGIGVLGGLAINRDGRRAEQRPAVAVVHPQLPDSVAARTVRFVLMAPQASKVSVVGDFNGWDSRANPMSTQGADGTWTVYVPLEPGLHTYSFVVDGSHFVSDPAAPIAPTDDGFGHPSSVVLVRKPAL
jgi:hypothetical protein